MANRNKRTGPVNEVIEEQSRAKRRSSDVMVWTRRLQLSDQLSNPYYEEYQRNLDYYVGKQISDLNIDDMLLTRDNYIVVNRILPALAASNAQIMWRMPWFYQRSRQPLGSVGESMRESAEYLSNFALQTRRNNFLLQARLMLLATELGVGVLKVCYTPDDGIEEDEDDEEVLGELIVHRDPMTGQEQVEIVGGIPKTDPVTGQMMRRGDNKFVIETRNPLDKYRIDWKDWRDMRFDSEGANDIQDHAWVAERMSWRLDEFRNNPLFTEKEGIERAARYMMDTTWDFKRRRLEHGMKRPRPQQAGTDVPKSEEDQLRIWGYQIHDIKKRRVHYIVDGYHKMVASVPYAKWIDCLPYVTAKFHEVPGEFFPYPEITAARPLARSYNILRSQILNHRSRFNRKYEVQKGACDLEEMEKLKDPEDGTVVMVRNVGLIRPIEDAKLDDAVYRDINQDIFDMSEIMGSTPEARGIAQSDTATQAAIMERRGTSREADKRAIVGAALERAADLMLDALQANLDTSVAVSILGPNGQQWQKVLSRVQIQGNFEAKVDLEELQPKDQRADASQMLELAQILGPDSFGSPLFMKRLLQGIRGLDDPDLVNELSAIFQMQSQLRAQQGMAETGPAKGGAKPETGTGPEGGASFEGRSQGRQLRTIGGAA